MQDLNVENDLTIEAANTGVVDLSRYTLQTRLELIFAALQLNATNPLRVLTTSHSTVVTSAQTRHTTNVR